MKNLFLLTIVALALSSCSQKVYFTKETKEKLEAKGVDLKKIQYYNSETVVLLREIKDEEIKVAEGKVRIENGKNVEEIIIKRNTPGVFTEANTSNAMMIQFEKGNNKILPFVPSKDYSGRKNIYELGSLDVVNSGGSRLAVVNYDDKKYSIVYGNNAALLIDKSVLVKEERKTRVAEGVKVK
ncbi:MAG: hypothetical protein AB7G44_13700 [Bacteroidia bacterium]